MELKPTPNILSIVLEYNKIVERMEDWNDDFSNPSAEAAPGKTIRFSWDEWTGIEYGWQRRHRYVSPEEAAKELEMLKEDMEEYNNENQKRKI